MSRVPWQWSALINMPSGSIYLKNWGGTNLLVSLVGGPWDDIKQIDFDALPSSFVLKATHGCKMNYFVPDKNKLNVQECKNEMRR
jgi:hypothetical protein